MSNLAVIPARGGSTRLKNKNITPLLGKPLIRWMTNSVLESGCFDKVIISTDCDKIFDAVADLNVERHIRPEHHATVSATVLDAMMDLMDEVETYNTFSYFLPTCPFISPDDILKGMEKLEQRQCDTVISMTQIPETVQLACLMSEDNVLPVFDNLEWGITNSKFIKKYYKPSGAFYMGLWNYLKENRNFFNRKTKGVIIPSSRSVDINTIEDIKYAESIAW
jgi:N-acylneuraminate cytidylyltransferase